MPVVALVACLALASCDWVQPGFDTSRSNYNPGETAIGVANVADLEEEWSATLTPTSGGVDPLRVGNRLFVVANGEQGNGSAVVALDATTGDELWRADFGGFGDPEYLSPILAITTWGTTVVVTRLVGQDPGEIVNLDMATGAELLSYGGGDGYTDPVVKDGNLYVGYVDFGSGLTAGVAGFDVTSGQEFMRSAASAVVQPRQVARAFEDIFVGAGPRLEAYRAFPTPGDTCGQPADQCTPRWAGDLGGVGATMPAVDGQYVYVGSTDGTLSVFWPHGCQGGPTGSTCEPMWTSDTGGTLAAGAAVGDGGAFLLTVEGTLVAYDTAWCGEPTCAPAWTAPAGAPAPRAPPRWPTASSTCPAATAGCGRSTPTAAGHPRAPRCGRSTWAGRSRANPSSPGATSTPAPPARCGRSLCRTERRPAALPGGRSAVGRSPVVRRQPRTRNRSADCRKARSSNVTVAPICSSTSTSAARGMCSAVPPGPRTPKVGRCSSTGRSSGSLGAPRRRAAAGGHGAAQLVAVAGRPVGQGRARVRNHVAAIGISHGASSLLCVAFDHVRRTRGWTCTWTRPGAGRPSGRAGAGPVSVS